ncbi:MAG: hypothetical protein A2534_00190 [Candidatus Magasanikbacteria bacterium RIFOXYD2_FULL_39_9]|uniref:Uncharacterized protein n=1 Tax=Candidatus Magasanikbacteria bacterium RIFOXYD1_FULL_40_23 TaxID=1798705 RepID=A0A1F6P9J6_9BACT|nr:MAG: hypothetical protein A2563_02920 [Candidatus Magasanikbacteria bacterium RIFOXYD1_FULL_40_23]OGH93564.1 MAG: hypothetical protein A2534_00190 [Candidatus Magasanikbacteria bacterium RIFOXYD2_FULL_39_9]
MKIYIKAKPNSYEDKVEKIDDTHFVVAVKEPPQNGLANKGICRTLAKYFEVSQSMVVVKKGFTSKNKIIEIL